MLTKQCQTPSPTLFCLLLMSIVYHPTVYGLPSVAYGRLYCPSCLPMFNPPTRCLQRGRCVDALGYQLHIALCTTPYALFAVLALSSFRNPKRRGYYAMCAFRESHIGSQILKNYQTPL